MLLRCTRQGQLNLTGSGAHLSSVICHLYFFPPCLLLTDMHLGLARWKWMEAEAFSDAFLMALSEIRRAADICSVPCQLQKLKLRVIFQIQDRILKSGRPWGEAEKQSKSTPKSLQSSAKRATHVTISGIFI